MKDLDFIAGDYLYGDLPTESEYLSQYFNTGLERNFLSYYLLFSDLYLSEGFLRFYHNFSDHTGSSCTQRWVRELLRRCKDLDISLNIASKNFDLSSITKIKTGKLRTVFK